MTIDNWFSVDFRDDVNEKNALAMAERLGLTVRINCYQEQVPARELFVSCQGEQREIGALIAMQPEVLKVYSEATSHVLVPSPLLSYEEMLRKQIYARTIMDLIGA